MFLILSFLSVILNPNKTHNFMVLLYLAIQTIIPLTVDKNLKEDKVYKEIYIMSLLTIFITFFVAASSFIIFLKDFKGSVTVNNAEYLFGIFEGRLFGIMGNPNSGSLIALIAIIVSLIILAMRKYKLLRIGKIMKVFLIVNIILQFIILFLGNSRSTFVSLCAAFLLIFTYNYLRKFNKSVKSIITKVITILLICVITLSGLYLLSKASNKIVSYLPEVVSKIEAMSSSKSKVSVQKNAAGSENENTSTNTGSTHNTPEITAPVDANRKYNSADISNSRFDIWKIGFKVFKNNPILGVGSENIHDAAIKVATSDFSDPGILGNMHNIYIQILAGSGLFALIAILAFLFRYLLINIGSFAKEIKSKSSAINIYIFSMIVALCVENFFDSNIVYFMCLFIVPIFWNYLGYSIYLAQRKGDIN
ncbi:O-antigen ligase family protein [Candidatus Clostridium radicumherbarum]|uniref:O-antigen ligase family protein n=1 Tax=Candidatus Clostridium radicumherbarum TaxID=3381662 RepID=A0ABW8TTA5_9CLOT